MCKLKKNIQVVDIIIYGIRNVGANKYITETKKQNGSIILAVRIKYNILQKIFEKLKIETNVPTLKKTYLYILRWFFFGTQNLYRSFLKIIVS